MGQIGLQYRNALNVCRALSCLRMEGFSLTCICVGFYDQFFFRSRVHSDSKFDPILFRQPLCGSLVSQQIKPISFLTAFFRLL